LPPEREVSVTQADAAGGWHEQVRAAFAAAGRDTLVDRMGITLVEASAGRVVGTMPVAGNTQPAGVLHGGASCVLAETLGSLGAVLHAGPGKTTVGVDINATHHRGPVSGEVTGVATLLHGGRTVASYEVVITDDQGRRVCTARLTCLLRELPAGHPLATPGNPPGDEPGTSGDGQATRHRTDD
jgi:1,4-dihydroxy-2-naphthoyl-CoA hydrolase